MIKEIEKLINDVRKDGHSVAEKLTSIAAKIKKETLHGKNFLVLDINEMESWIIPSKVSEEINIGKVELEL